MSRLRIARAVTAEDRNAFAQVRQLADPAAPAEDAPGDAECLVAWDGDDPVARCSVSLAVDLVGAPGFSGLIGHYDASDGRAGTALLQHAAMVLAERGARRVLGPMNGSTWSRYRLALPAHPEDPQGNPPFFLGEPRNPFGYPAHFESARFTVCAAYESRSFRTLPDDSNPALRAEPLLPPALQDQGITVSTLDLNALERTLTEVFALSLDAFARNPYYAPISEGRSSAPFLALRPLIDPKLVLLARNREGELVSVLFGYPDPMFKVNDRPVRAIVKTLATLTRYRGARIARHLLEVFRARTAALRYDLVIHALMHVANTSMKLSGEQHSELFRRYALYEWKP